ncbi:N-acetyltransferase [Noviherbaspirillum sp. L7-7A]|uniref:GNAT family N-acetyltransferase n=1 Tax=Noviherbaspirillum sp. L7-7A TaxID=2850560 RepID=UPI001C2C1A9B|nr:GNAT family N-acetyltransferase [Noviherbaspirillum sp. L7-7A]MBV0881812.1 N-acetyltransferase [Noviherbaspirillum sp. L7-7A]
MTAMTGIEAREGEQNAAQRLTLESAGSTVAYVEYYLFGRVVIVTHTEVDPAYEGKGNGSEMARQALAHFRRQQWHVVPVCGFFAEQIRRQPEYLDLVTPHSRCIFDL